MSTQGPSTSSPSYSSSNPRWIFDVFLSLRGVDTRNTLGNLLYAALKHRGVLTFYFYEVLERGRSISLEIFKAIEGSRIAIVIFSRNYAYSRWCLDELTKIIECSKETGMTVLPVFYYVDPFDVRNQTGPFAQAFAEYEDRFTHNIEKVERWRAALREVANLSGWLVQDGHVSELIQSIVEQILQNLSSSFSSIANGLVGIDSSVEELFTSYLDRRNNVCMIGVCGMGGSGKTTLARVIYEKFHSYFEGSSFIANVRECSKRLDLLQLQQLLLADFLEERNVDIRNVYHGVDMIKERLCRKKVLIVLDDVNKLDQLENLVGDHGWFGLGSLIIITTRDKNLLVHHGVHNIYKPNPLNSDDALELFCLKAFKNKQPKEGYMQLSQDVVRYANGHPLALKTFGSFLFGRTMDVWQSALDRFKKIPEREIFDTLKVSYDGLEEMWKAIFLDVACFFRGKMRDQVIEILETCGFDAKIGIQVLMDKSLLTIENDALQMHDLLQEMGMEIVRRESREEPGKRSRLWLRKDLFHVLMNNTATKAIQAIVLDLCGGDDPYRNIESYSEVFSKMRNLRLLIIDNVHIPNGLNHPSNELRLLEWHGYTSKCLPSRFQSKELVELRLPFSKIEFLWRGVKYIDKLKLINLEHSINLITTPNFIGVPRLEKLCLRGCINLVEIHPSIGQLSQLSVLNLEFCQSLINLPSSMDSLRSLEILSLLGCSKLANLPENLGRIKCLKELDLTGAAIREVPSSISFLICRGCEKQFFKSRIDSVLCVRSLKYIALSTNNLVFALPASISQLLNLEALNLGNCIQLHSLTNLPSNVRYINAKGCSSLEPSLALLSLSNLSQPSISFFNCCKLVEYNEGCDGLACAMLKRYLQGLHYPKTGFYETSTKRKVRSRAAFQIIIPGLDVPEWLNHQRIGYSICIELPPNWCNSRWMGFALCALFRINYYGYSSERYSLKGHVKALGDMPHHTVIGETSFEVVIGETSFDNRVCHLWLLYWSRDDLLGTHWNDHECNRINVIFDSDSPSVKVIKCAIRLIYEQDVEEGKQTIAQCSSSCVITSEGSDSVHHEFENSAVVKATKIRRTHDDNEETECNASWSFPEETGRAMGKTEDEEKESKSKQFGWSEPMQCLLLEILANDAGKGNKPSNTFMPGSLIRAAQEISEKFGVECQPNHVENCLQTIKSIWSTITQLRNRKNIFRWDDNLKMITCEKKVYVEEVMAHPDHEQYLNKKIEMNDKMALIFCKDVATWSSTKSFSDIDSEKRIVDLESNDPDIDFEKASKGEQVSSSNAASCHRKRSRANQDANYGKISKQLRKVELAIRELEEGQLDMKELYEEVMKIEGFDEVMLASAFDYLVDNERAAQAFMAKNARLRTFWLENFCNKNGTYGNLDCNYLNLYKDKN